MSNGVDSAKELRLKAFDTVSDWSKQVTTIASATLVLSATFIKDILGGHTEHTCYLWTSWFSLLATVVVGVFVLGALASNLNDGNPAQLDIYSGSILGASVVQILLFLIGMIAFILFVMSNLSAAPVKQGNEQPPTVQSKPTLASRVSELNDAYFDFNKSAIRQDAQQTLTNDARLLHQISRDFPDGRVVIEVHCDERGASDRNFGLGYARALSAREFLGNLGVPSTNLGVATYGKEIPVCKDHDESCWQQNRRIHFSTIQ